MVSNARVPVRCALFRNETWQADRAAQLYLFRTEGFSLTKLFTRLDCDATQDLV